MSRNTEHYDATIRMMQAWDKKHKAKTGGNQPQGQGTKAARPKQFKGRFTGIEDWLWLDTSLSATAKMVYARLKFYARQKGYSYISQAQLGAELGRTTRTIRRCIRQLETRQLIADIGATKYGVRKYKVEPAPKK